MSRAGAFPELMSLRHVFSGRHMQSVLMTVRIVELIGFSCRREAMQRTCSIYIYTPFASRSLDNRWALARAALTGKHDTLARRAPCQLGALRIHLTRLSTEGLGPRHGEVRRAHQMLNAALHTT